MIFAIAALYYIGWFMIDRRMEATMAAQDYLQEATLTVIDHFNGGGISYYQAKEEMKALILASVTVRDLELTHNAYDSIEE